MAKDGWIKLHRKILDSDIFTNPNLLKFWIWCLCKATHEPIKQRVGLQVVELKPGQFIFGREKAALELGMTKTTTYRYLMRLQDEQILSIKVNSKFTVVNVEKWGFYQSRDKQGEQISGQIMNRKWTDNGQIMDTNKNDKKYKECKEEKNMPAALSPLADPYGWDNPGYEVVKDEI